MRRRTTMIMIMITRSSWVECVKRRWICDDDDNQCERRPQEEPAQNFGSTNSLVGSRHPVKAIFKLFTNFRQQNWDSYGTWWWCQYGGWNWKNTPDSQRQGYNPPGLLLSPPHSCLRKIWWWGSGWDWMIDDRCSLSIVSYIDDLAMRIVVVRLTVSNLFQFLQWKQRLSFSQNFGRFTQCDDF